ncbi:MAG: hypothetical protein AMXMBFR48_19060 [Ignavibacteriales bacterium]
MANTLLAHIKNLTQLSADDEKQIEDVLEKKTIRKRQFLLHEHQIAKVASFVLSGCLRSYSIDRNGFEHILQFAPENWWITDMFSFISGKESYLNVDALVDTEVLILRREDQQTLCEKIPQLEHYFRVITEKALVSTQQRLMDNMSTTARQRYEKFCNTYPGLINTLPQKLIASYIGITPEFLSKIRGEALK